LALMVAGSLAADSNRSAEFYDAIRTNDLTRLERLSRSGAEVNVKDDHDKTPLMYAAAVGSLEAMKILIGKGADVNAQNESGLTPLILAANDLAKQRVLLERGAHVNAATKLGRTALSVAAMSDGSADIVRLLVAKGADAKAVDAFKNTMLTAAAA